MAHREHQASDDDYDNQKRAFKFDGASAINQSIDSDSLGDQSTTDIRTVQVDEAFYDVGKNRDMQESLKKLKKTRVE